MNPLFPAGSELIRQMHDQLVRLREMNTFTTPALDKPLSKEQLSTLIETGFWASLRTYEGRPTQASLAIGIPNRFQDANILEKDVPYDAPHIAKLAPAALTSGSIIVSPSSTGEFRIRGLAAAQSGSWMDGITISLSRPGVLCVGIGFLRPYAILQGSSEIVFNEGATNIAAFLNAALRKTSPENDIIQTQAAWRESGALAAIARMILEDGHGGAVLIVPDDDGDWVNSLTSFECRFASPDTAVRDGIRQELHNSTSVARTIQQLSEANISDELRDRAIAGMSQSRGADARSAMRRVASLAGVDGAVVVTRDLRVLGFGAKIGVTDVSPSVYHLRPELREQALVAERVQTSGGTRHQSAARFVAANKESAALVISQDVHLSVMHWHPPADGVAILRNAEWLV
jgi:hypothetical protein